MSAKVLISEVEMSQVKEGSWISTPFQSMRFCRDVAEIFSLGITLGRTLVSPYSFPFLNFTIWFTAKSRSWESGLARRDRRRHSGWAYQ